MEEDGLNLMPVVEESSENGMVSLRRILPVTSDNF